MVYGKIGVKNTIESIKQFYRKGHIRYVIRPFGVKKMNRKEKAVLKKVLKDKGYKLNESADHPWYYNCQIQISLIAMEHLIEDYEKEKQK